MTVRIDSRHVEDNLI